MISPVIDEIGVMVGSTPDDNAFEGEWAVAASEGQEGGHSMTLVGYNDHLWIDVNGNGRVERGEKGALKAVNSEGTDYRNGGFVWIAYDALRPSSQVPGAKTKGRRPAIAGPLVYWMTARTDYEPTALAEFTLEHDRRDRLAVRFAVARGGRDPRALWRPAVYFLDGAGGGPYNLAGGVGRTSSMFVMDFSAAARGRGPQSWYLEVAAGGEPAVLTRLQWTDAKGVQMADAGLPATVGQGFLIRVAEGMDGGETAVKTAARPEGPAAVGDAVGAGAGSRRHKRLRR